MSPSDALTPLWRAALKYSPTLREREETPGLTIVIMIDARWCGASGRGGYRVVASEIVNAEARTILAERAAA